MTLVGHMLTGTAIGVVAMPNYAHTRQKTAFLLICIATWLLCAVFFFVTSIFIKKDVETLRGEMALRAEQERMSQTSFKGVS